MRRMVLIAAILVSGTAMLLSCGNSSGKPATNQSVTAAAGTNQSPDADWKTRMDKLAELKRLWLKLTAASENADDVLANKANLVEFDMQAIADELDLIYPTLSDAEKKEFDARYAEIDKIDGDEDAE